MVHEAVLAVVDDAVQQFSRPALIARQRARCVREQRCGGSWPRTGGTDHRPVLWGPSGWLRVRHLDDQIHWIVTSLAPSYMSRAPRRCPMTARRWSRTISGLFEAAVRRRCRRGRRRHLRRALIRRWRKRRVADDDVAGGVSAIAVEAAVHRDPGARCCLPGDRHVAARQLEVVPSGTSMTPLTAKTTMRPAHLGIERIAQ